MSHTSYAVQMRAAERQVQWAFDCNDDALMQDALRRIEQLTWAAADSRDTVCEAIDASPAAPTDTLRTGGARGAEFERRSLTERDWSDLEKRPRLTAGQQALPTSHVATKADKPSSRVSL